MIDIHEARDTIDKLRRVVEDTELLMYIDRLDFTLEDLFDAQESLEHIMDVVRMRELV